MAKSKRRKGDGLAKEVRRRAHAAGTAPAHAPHQAGTSGSATSRIDLDAIRTQIDAWQFLLNYLNYVRDGGFDVPLDQFGPQRPNETAEQAELRLTVARKTKEVQALAGNWAELCAVIAADDMLALNPDTMVAHVADVGRGWLKTAGHVPDRDEWMAGARPLLGVLCAPEHWSDALNVLDQVGTMGIVPGESAPLVVAAARAKPVAALHAVTALVTWLYGQRSIVFDQTATMRTLARRNQVLAESLGSA